MCQYVSINTCQDNQMCLEGTVHAAQSVSKKTLDPNAIASLKLLKLQLLIK